jgi:anti-sigma B factor antagonist
MIIEEQLIGNVLVLKVKQPRIDAAVSQDFKRQLSQVVEKGHKRFVLDISSTNFIDSSGLGAIVSSLKHIGITGGVLIAGAQNNVQVLFKMTRMDKIFSMYTTPAEAIAAIS